MGEVIDLDKYRNNQTWKDRFYQVEGKHAQISGRRIFAYQNRLKILELIVQSPHTVRELSGSIGLSEATCRKHLKILETNGFVTRRGRKWFYVKVP